MAHQIQIKELVNGIEITENLDGVVVVKLLSYNSRPFLRTTNEDDVESYQVLDTLGEIYHLPALANEFILIDLEGNYWQPDNGTELIEYSYKIRAFRPENEFDRVLNVGTVEATANTVKVNIPSVGLPNSVLINGSVYENYYPSLFNFVAVVEFTKILIVYAKPDNTVFYLAQGVEALSAVEPDYEGLFVARIIASIDGNIIEYPNYGVITEDSDTVAFTGNGTAGNPLSAEGYNGSYSTTETLTGGTWIDGKPIYRKVLPYTFDSDGIGYLNFSDLNTNTIIHCNALYRSLDGNMCKEYNTFALNSIEYFYSKLSSELPEVNIYLQNIDLTTGFTVPIEPDNSNGFLILEYTKTTDVAP
jgi:hypothetical protein